MLIAGEHDFLKQYGKELIDSCVEPVVIHHPKGHTVPRLGVLLILSFYLVYMFLMSGLLTYSYLYVLNSLSFLQKNGCLINSFLLYFSDEKSLNTMMSFIERIQNDISENKEEVQSMS